MLVRPSLLAALALTACAAQQARPEPSRLYAIADEYAAAALARDPSPAYYGVLLKLARHDYLPDNSDAARLAWEHHEDSWLAQLDALDADEGGDRAAQVLHAQLREALEASIGLRTCHGERWNVSHMGGWHTALAELADRQPVATPADREQALARWRGFGAYVDREIAHARVGLDSGYSVPRAVVDHVLEQLDGLIVDSPEDSAYFAPGRKANDAAFAAEFRRIVAEIITPALVRYRDFVRNEYRPRARETIAISALPDGLACYTALLRAYSTLQRDPREVYETGVRTVQANEERVRELGMELFGTRDLATILARVESAPDNRFANADEVLAFARDSMARARERTATVFAAMPKQEAVVEAFPEYQRGSGMSSHYEAVPDDAQPGIYRINLDHPEAERRGRAEITLVHEAWPGHHMQIAYARGLPGMHPLAELAWNSAYVEGWARYAEALAEEAGIYQTKYALVTRRIWPARGMVVDPGIHAFGWTRERAVEYLLSTGRFTDTTANELVDRIAATPGQVTAYDSGGLALFALREQAEREFGPRFSLQRFNTQLLSDGVVPLALLRQRVEAWIAAERSAPN